MAGYGRSTAEVLYTVGRGLTTQSCSVEHGTHFNSGDVPADWNPNFGQYIPCSKSLKPLWGVISYLRKIGGDKNPARSGLIKVTASSYEPRNEPRRILDWSSQKSWYPDLSDTGPWIELDFLDKRVIVKEYAMYTCGSGRHLMGGWTLSGRNSEDEPWETIDERYDQLLEDLGSGPIVFPSAVPDKMFRYLMFDGLRHGEGCRFVPGVEFFGALVILKEPSRNPTEPETAS